MSRSTKGMLRNLLSDESLGPGLRGEWGLALLRDEHAGAVPRTSTFALTGVTFPYLEALAQLGFKRAVEADPALAAGVNTHNGKVVHPGLRRFSG